ncbi:MAG: hypothetical protein IPK82_23200 [Polyangiaceae bacterium]|nr:hypothetical protein [Polyangiaceae bacterium]
MTGADGCAPVIVAADSGSRAITWTNCGCCCAGITPICTNWLLLLLCRHHAHLHKLWLLLLLCRHHAHLHKLRLLLCRHRATRGQNDGCVVVATTLPCATTHITRANRDNNTDNNANASRRER